MHSSPELKPCPFCGSEKVKAWKDYNWYVFCRDCNCCTPWRSTREEVTEMWNRRSGAQAPSCPFCGGGSRIQEVFRKGNNRVICRMCGCATAWDSRSVNASYKVWNRRVNE
ncbi:MAG: Lar family restriction alleviation protein [Candidatus Methanomethylophilaceae archaeon]|nr:Lar family restriction alleviation protein [Candidatus Methanomethylophilaceae archaeon]